MKSVNLGDLRNLDQNPKVKDYLNTFMLQKSKELGDDKAIKYFNTDPKFRNLLKTIRKGKLDIQNVIDFFAEKEKKFMIFSAEIFWDKIKIQIKGGDVMIEPKEAPQDLLQNYKNYYYIENLVQTGNPAIKDVINIRFEKKPNQKILELIDKLVGKKVIFTPNKASQTEVHKGDIGEVETILERKESPDGVCIVVRFPDHSMMRAEKDEIEIVEIIKEWNISLTEQKAIEAFKFLTKNNVKFYLKTDNRYHMFTKDGITYNISLSKNELQSMNIESWYVWIKKDNGWSLRIY